ncbi:hypothetical protein TWF694_009422 [Orbilia ellipsospora]|uniref:Uncharacterized protein n=1 Tax=Orbilia ellipsospora TaxID=2528407 RepID=A0AAV9XH28_9PEZI
MKLFNIATLTLALATSSLASPITKASNPFESGIFYPMHFTGSVTPGGPVMDLYGSVQELVPQIQKIDHGWTPPKGKSPHAPGVVKRYFHGNPICSLGPEYGTANTGRLENEVIPYLLAFGVGNCGAKPWSCSRVSCAWDSAIWLCNDHTDIEIHVSCERLGQAAQHIIDQPGCTTNFGPFEQQTKGYWEDTTGYYVLVAGSDC